VFLGGSGGNVVAVGVKDQVVLASQAGDKSLIRVGLRPAQLVVEMHDRENDAKFAAQFEKQAQEGDRIDSAGDGDAYTISGPQQVLPPDVGEHALGKGMHGNMVQRGAHSTAVV
jgi:hypothetical protein